MIMANFLMAAAVLLKVEGGYSSRDNGAGAVNFGITERFLAQIHYSKRDPKLLTQPEALEIYRTHFWEPYHCGEIVDQKLATAYLLAIVNMGTQRPTLDLQEALVKCGADVDVDGSIGEKTVDAVNAAPADQLLAEFKAELKERYRRIAISIAATEGMKVAAKELSDWERRVDIV